MHPFIQRMLDATAYPRVSVVVWIQMSVPEIRKLFTDALDAALQNVAEREAELEFQRIGFDVKPALYRWFHVLVCRPSPREVFPDRASILRSMAGKCHALANAVEQQLGDKQHVAVFEGADIYTHFVQRPREIAAYLLSLQE